MPALSKLIDSQLESYEIENTEASFQFSVGVLSVYNPVGVRGEIESIIGSTVLSVSCVSGKSLDIEFSNGSFLTVSLSHSHYVSPEAFCMRFKSGVFVVE